MHKQPYWVKALLISAGVVGTVLLLLVASSWYLTAFVLLGLVVFILIIYFNPATFYRRLILTCLAIAVGLVTPVFSIFADILNTVVSDTSMGEHAVGLLEIISGNLNGYRWESAGLFIAVALVATWGDVTLRSRNLSQSENGVDGQLAPSLAAEYDVPSDSLFSRSDRAALLARVKKHVISPRLNSGLRAAIRIELNVAESLAFVGGKLRTFGSLESGEIPEREIHEDITNYYKDIADGRLLILGDPGAGKTNLLLELASSLIDEAGESANSTIPLVFSLSRWTRSAEPRSLKEWMRDELRDFYELSGDVADHLVSRGRILPLLDGLDEVALEKRGSCVSAIQEYQRATDIEGVVVCCRVEEYQALKDKLDMGSAVRVGKLSRSDVERTISHEGLEHVRTALMQDPDLWGVVDTPLWLQVLYLAATVNSFSEYIQNPRERLYAKYVEYALNRTLAESPRNRTTSKKLLRYLRWLAVEMRDRDQAQFAPHDIDSSWVAKKFSRKLARPEWLGSRESSEHVTTGGGQSPSITATHRLLFGVIIGAAAGYVGGLLFGVVAGILAALRVEGRVEPSEELYFDWSKARTHWKPSLIYSGAFGAIFAADSGLSFDSTLMVAAVAGGVMAAIAFIFETLQGGFHPRPMSRRVGPNEKTSRSVRHVVKIASLGGGVALLAAVLAEMAYRSEVLSFESQTLVLHGVAWFGFATVVLALEKGGWFALRHYGVRLLLWAQGYMPWRYVGFLDEAVERLFLVRRGSSYEFFHLTFRDYMARHGDADSGGTLSDNTVGIAPKARSGWMGSIVFSE